MKLFVVGLPIGNIEDMSVRAIKTIQTAPYLVCEDTRMFSNLWTKLVSLGLAEKFTGKLRFINDFNEQRQLPKVISEMALEERAVLVSDAGMPLISDPGYKLVKSALDLDWEVEVVPGPTAESSALAISGLPTDKYLFLGFLPKKEGKRKEVLRNALVDSLINYSVVIYESAVRAVKILEEIAELNSSLTVFVGVDITKVSEKQFRGSLSDVIEQLKTKPLKGEVTVVLHEAKLS